MSRESGSRLRQVFLYIDGRQVEAMGTNKQRAWVVVACVMFLMSVDIVSATLVRGIDISFVRIGNAGNAADAIIMSTDGTSGYGAVDYDYSIGKYEVTNAQWDAFTAAVGPPPEPFVIYGSPTWSDEQPANQVSWYAALQFCNYLTSGDKSQGIYQFSGNNAAPGNFIGVNSAIKTGGSPAYWLPTEDEWYKTAYYKPDGSGYSLYANGSDTMPGVNEGWNYSGSPYITPVGVGMGPVEQNGTYDIMGNVWEWNETMILGDYGAIRGSSFQDAGNSMASDYRYGTAYTDASYGHIGFRVASNVPEPCTLFLLTFGSLIVTFRRR